VFAREDSGGERLYAVGRSLTTALTATALLAKTWLVKGYVVRDRPLFTCATAALGRKRSFADVRYRPEAVTRSNGTGCFVKST